MRVAANQTALYAAIPPAATTGSLNQLNSVPAGWWDASSPAYLIGPGGNPVGAWGAAGSGVVDRSASARALLPFANPASGTQAQIVPHLSGVLGGAGFPTATPGLLQPSLDPGTGWQVPAITLNEATNWTLFLVWSRPNWRQGSNVDAAPITLLAVGGTPLCQIDSANGSGRLVLFPKGARSTVAAGMTRRHTHAIILRYSAGHGIDVWLDQSRVANVPSSAIGSFSGQVLLLHDGTLQGSAQCWLHEAAIWTQAISDSDILSVLQYQTRWTCGSRRGLYFLVNGQSNAVNYTEVDGAAALLARGLAWHLGALACNVLATTTSATNFTMASGHGIYAVTGAGYPGSFVQNPGDGSSPATWSLGLDGLAVQRAITSLAAEDLSDMSMILWPWNETDSLRNFDELTTFQAASRRFLSLLRGMLGDTTSRIPLVWWNAIPYGTAAGITMHRQAVQAITADPAQNAIIGNFQTSDSNPRGSSWDSASGIATGGDPAHRDSIDNLRFAVLAAPIVARKLITGGFADSIASLPAVLPQRGGPAISHVYRSSATTLILTIAHDAGTDLKVPLQAANGVGFAVMDGGSPANPGAIINATACRKIDATHLSLQLATPLQNASSACLLFYPYGPAQIGRGNAVTDNFSSVTLPADWQASAQLGSAWVVDYPLAATFNGIPLSDTPA